MKQSFLTTGDKLVDVLAATLVLCLVVSDAALAQVPPGYEVVEIASGPKFHQTAAINNCGEIVFHVGLNWEDETEFFLFDNGITQQMTNNNISDSHPDINENGDIAWVRGFDGFGGGQIFLSIGGIVSMLGEGTSPSINGLGHVVWDESIPATCARESRIMFYDGVTITQVTDNGLSNQSPRINDADQITWPRKRRCPSGPWTSEIMLATGGVIIPLPVTAKQAQNVDINNLGHVVWSGQRTIEVWDGESVTAITDDGSNAHINDKGEILFIRFHQDIGAWQPWLYRPTPEPTFFRLIEDFGWNVATSINEHGECVWVWIVSPNNFSGGIRYMRRIRNGDVDFDFDVDILDYETMPACITGPGDFDRLCDCRFLDLDHDRDVDLRDYADFQNRFGGRRLSLDCCSAHTAPGCNDPDVETCVCTGAPSCCADTWSDQCAAYASVFCSAPCP